MFNKKRTKGAGYIYIASNPSFPGLIKIGMTSKSPMVRVRSLYNTSVPTPFKLEYSAQVPERENAEKYLHSVFEKYRVSKNREFFRLDVKTAINQTEKYVPGLKRREYRKPGRLRTLFKLIPFCIAVFVLYHLWIYGVTTLVTK